MSGDRAKPEDLLGFYNELGRALSSDQDKMGPVHIQMTRELMTAVINQYAATLERQSADLDVKSGLGAVVAKMSESSVSAREKVDRYVAKVDALKLRQQALRGRCKDMLDSGTAPRSSDLKTLIRDLTNLQVMAESAYTDRENEQTLSRFGKENLSSLLDQVIKATNGLGRLISWVETTRADIVRLDKL